MSSYNVKINNDKTDNDKTDNDKTDNDLKLELIAYKTNLSSKTRIQKYHIIRQNGITIKHKICNVYAPFGRQTNVDHKTKQIFDQHRLNICFSKNQIDPDSKHKPYLELKRLITELETYFGTFDDLTNYQLLSNIINRDDYGIVIRFHLKTNKNKTITPLIQVSSENLNNIDIVDNTKITEWNDFNKTKQFNFNFHPDSLWIDHIHKKYGVSLMIDKVFQII